MARERTSEYDRDAQTLWVDFSDLSGQSLIKRDQLKPYTDILRDSKRGPDPVKAINFVFTDEATARYNRDSLAFSRIGTYVKFSGVRRPLDGDTPDFQTRDDFGIR